MLRIMGVRGLTQEAVLRASSIPVNVVIFSTALAVAAFTVGGVAAQSPGQVEGEVVHGPLGTPVVGVEVQLLLQEGPDRTLRTGDHGEFRFRGVPPGSHRLRVRRPGFHPLDRTVELEPEGRVRVRLELTPLTLDLDTLRVVASPLSIRRTDTEFTARIDRQAMDVLPMAYDPEGMVILAPGAAPGRIWGGAADEANLYQLDGMTYTHPGSGGPILQLSPAWLEAVEVRGLGAGAEHGSFQGGIVNAVTRTGSNTRTTGFRSTLEHRALNATNLVDGEVGRERTGRWDVEMDAGGPIVHDRLFYFVGGQFLADDTRAQSRLPQVEQRFLDHTEGLKALRGFGKLTWTPGAMDRLDVAGGFSSGRVENWGLTGFEARDALGRRTSSSWFYHGSWRRGSDPDRYLEIRAAGADSRERTVPDRGLGVPGVRLYAPGDPPMPIFRNAPYQLDQRPAVHSVSATLARRFHTGGWTHRIRMGTELTRSRWMDRRHRTGGMTWRAVGTGSFDPAQPSTWFFSGVLPSDWGGEVDLNARMGSEALFAQNHLTLHPRLSVSPGIRLARWRGDLLPGGDGTARFEAVRTRGLEPRLGLTFDPLGTNELVLKAHWGRIHQNLLASFFDRAQGGNVFSDREVWYYRNGPFEDAGTTFTRGERDAMAGASPPGFTREEVIRLNETGPVAENLRQPHVDQWLVGLEKAVGPRIRLEALWVDRANRNLIALEDLNLAKNYHRYDHVQVLDGNGEPLGLGDGPLVLPSVYVPNDWIRQILVWLAEAPNGNLAMPPGFVLADTLGLSYEQDLELRNVPEADRRLRQLQLSAHAAFSNWGGSASLVHSRLTGNFNSVSGYEADTDFEAFHELGAGPFVRPNEQVNFDGDLPGLSALELKLAGFGNLPGGLRGGAFLHAARGERFTPYFTLTGFVFQYGIENGEGELLPLDPRLIQGVAGQRIWLQERGTARYEDRITLDLRLERAFSYAGGRWRITADVFNVWNAGAVMEVNPSVNYPTRESAPPALARNPAALFGAVWGRVPPRTIRLGVRATF